MMPADMPPVQQEIVLSPDWFSVDSENTIFLNFEMIDSLIRLSKDVVKNKKESLFSPVIKEDSIKRTTTYFNIIEKDGI